MTGPRLQARLWLWQRLSAMVLAVAVTVHLALILVAVRGGLSAAAILGRTRGSWAFGLFYAVFVAACAVHAPIGLANILREHLGWRGARVGAACVAFAALLLVAGMRAVWSVLAPGP